MNPQMVQSSRSEKNEDFFQGKQLFNTKIVCLAFTLIILNSFFCFNIYGNTMFKTLWAEGFESNNNSNTKISFSLTGATYKIIHPGILSEKCLKINKPDYCGFVICRFPDIKIPESTRNHWLRLSADINTLYKGFYSDYYFMVTQKSKGRNVGKNLFFPYDDGIVKHTRFDGGIYKTPQTRGEWKVTSHQFKLREGVDTVRILLVVRNGSQILLFDNIKLEDIGQKAIPRKSSVVLRKKINWPYGFIDFSPLPGAVYEIQAKVNKPVKEKKGRMFPRDASGMGVSMTSFGFKGRKKRVQLLPLPKQDGKYRFRMVIPDDATKVVLEFHNDDLSKLGHINVDKYARCWGDVNIILKNKGETARDNVAWQYSYFCNRRNVAKPPNYMLVNQFDLQVLKQKLLQRPVSSLKVEEYNGQTGLFLNEKPIAPMLVSTAPKHFNYNVISETVAARMNIIIMRYPYGGPAIHGGWNGKNKYDFSDLDQSMYQALMQNPNATLILSIDGLYPPLWWGQQNPDELLRDQNGNYVLSRSPALNSKKIGSLELLNRIADKAKRKKSGRYYWFGAKGPRAFYIPSNASEKYAQTMVKFLNALRRHIESQPYGKAVGGYRLCQGYDTQWGEPYYNYDSKNPHFFDYSVPMLNRFKVYLKRKYKTNEALTKAWNNKDITFDSVKIPGIQRRDIDKNKTKIFLLNPESYQDVIDFRDCMADLKSSLLLKFCKAIKDAGKKDVLTISYWPILQVSGSPINMKNIAKVMNSQYLDIYAGWSNLMHCSNVLHNKLFMREMDTRVFPAAKQSYANGKIYDTAQKSINELRRLYTLQICTGSGSWVFDLGMGWFNDSLIMQIIGDARKVYEKVLNFDRSPIAKIAVFIGNYSKQVQADGRRGVIPKMLSYNGFSGLFSAGTPIDQYYMCDLERVSDKYKVFYFPLAYGLRPEEIKQIESLKKNGNILVFGYGSGYVSSRKGLKNVEDVTGIKMGMDPSINNLTVKVKTNAHVLTKNLVGYIGYGESRLFLGVPKIYVNDSDAISLGTFAGDKKRTGMAIKNHGSWKSVYLGFIGYVPPLLFKNIAKLGGLHIYNQGNDKMYFNRSLIGINASSAGTKTIILPKKAKVTSLWDGKFLGSVKEIVRDMQTGENALYLIQKTASDDKK